MSVTSHNLWRKFLGLGETCMDKEYTFKLAAAQDNAKDIKKLLKEVNRKLDKEEKFKSVENDALTQQNSSNASN